MSRIEILDAVPLRDLIATRPTSPASTNKVVFVLESTPLGEIIQKMNHAKLLAVPVVNEQRKVIGFVDMFDIAVFLVKCPSYDQQLFQSSASKLINFSRMDRLLVLPEDRLAKEALLIFSMGIHRVALTSALPPQAAERSIPPAVAEYELSGICSQSDLIRYVSTQWFQGKGAEEAKTTVEQAGFVQASQAERDIAENPVLHIEENHNVAQAILKIANTGVSALAVTDAEGNLIGNFSPSDLRLLFATTGEAGESMLSARMTMSLRAFLEKWSPNSLNPVFVSASDSLAKVLDTMCAQRVHHVFVAAGGSGGPWQMPMLHKQLLGIVTQTDVCRWLMGYEKLSLSGIEAVAEQVPDTASSKFGGFLQQQGGQGGSSGEMQGSVSSSSLSSSPAPASSTSSRSPHLSQQQPPLHPQPQTQASGDQQQPDTTRGDYATTV
jgi:CBS domain-containing protein